MHKKEKKCIEKKKQKTGQEKTPSIKTTIPGSKFQLYQQWDLLPELALEAHDLLRGEHGGEIPGVKLTEEMGKFATIHTVTILDERGSRIMQKPEGTYVTIFSQELAVNHRGVQQELVQVVRQELQKFVQLPTLQDTVLVVGFGNWKSTPDSLGPQLINQLMATRHLHGNVPEEILKGVRPVVTIAPGVLGMTGIESADIVRGIAEQVKPSLILAIDALAAGSASRIGTTIQISDTGVTPGVGVGNQRAAINQETMGIPVISIGVPTIVKARIIAHNVLEEFWNQLQTRRHLSPLLQDLPQPALHNMMQNALQSCQTDLEVTPKEIDDLVRNCSMILANAITQTLHPNMNADFAASFF